MPSDEEIRRTLINMGGILDFSSFTRIVRALIRTAVERALAEQEARHKRELIEARIHELNLNGCRAETPTLRRLEDLRAELAALEVRGSGAAWPVTGEAMHLKQAQEAVDARTTQRTAILSAKLAKLRSKEEGS